MIARRTDSNGVRIAVESALHIATAKSVRMSTIGVDMHVCDVREAVLVVHQR